MNRAGLLLLILLILPAPIHAQDWRYDEAFDVTYSCVVIAKLVAAHGDDPMMLRADGEISSFEEVTATLFPICHEDAESFAAPAATGRRKSKRADEPSITALLRDHQTFTLFDLSCSVSVTDRFEEDLSVVLAGDWLDFISVDIYLPNQSTAIDMPNIEAREINVYGMLTPLRTQWAAGDSFPLGAYTIDVHVFDQTRRLQWLREDEAVNTIIFNCHDLAPANESQDEPEYTLTATLEDGDVYHLEDIACLIGTAQVTKDMFSVLVSGENTPNTTVEVTYPRMREPIQMVHVREMMFEGTPFRSEGVYADTFPPGPYHIQVTMHEHTWHFRWNRINDDYRTIIFNCPQPEEDD